VRTQEVLVGLAAEGAVRSYGPRRTTHHLHMPLESRRQQAAVPGIAHVHLVVGDQALLGFCEQGFVPKLRLGAELTPANRPHLRIEHAHQPVRNGQDPCQALLRLRYRLHGALHHRVQPCEPPLDGGAHLPMSPLHRAPGVAQHPLGLPDHVAGDAHHARRVALHRPLGLPGPLAQDPAYRTQGAVDRAAAVPKRGARGDAGGLQALDPSCDQPDPIGQEPEVRGMVKRGLNHGGVQRDVTLWIECWK
jgi:hypothetical protein